MPAETQLVNEIETTKTELRPESSFQSLDPRNVKLQTYINLIVTVFLLSLIHI